MTNKRIIFSQAFPERGFKTHCRSCRQAGCVIYKFCVAATNSRYAYLGILQQKTYV